MSASRKTIGVITLAGFALFTALAVIGCSRGTADAKASTAVLPAAKPSARPTIAAVGDIACTASEAVTEKKCQHGAVGAAITRAKPDSVWLLGDEQYYTGELAQFRASFDPAFGALRNRWRPTPGNHEYYTPGAAGYYDYFGKAAGPSRRGYYSFDIGSWHVVTLNSNCSDVDCSGMSPQAKWLRNDLKRHPARCTAAFWHHPMYSSGDEHGSDPRMRAMWQILQNRKADLVLAGHDHNFETFARQDAYGRRDAKRGMIEIVAGTGGGSKRGFGAIRPNSQVRFADTFGYLSLTLDKNSFDWSYINTDKKVLARSSARCH